MTDHSAKMQPAKRCGTAVLQILAIVRTHGIWLLALGFLNLLMAFLLWTTDAEAFSRIALFYCGCSASLYIVVLAYVVRKERKREQAFLSYLAGTDDAGKRNLEAETEAGDRMLVEQLTSRIDSFEQKIAEQEGKLHDFEEYVAVWAHEIKTPVSLLSLMLDNRQEELKPDIWKRLRYIRNQIGQDVDQMLYYTKLKGSVKDYYMEPLVLAEVVSEVLYQIRPDLEERGIQVASSNLDICVFTDERGLSFMLGQLMNNAVKYTAVDGTGRVQLFATQTNGEIQLHIKDNGVGVKPYDLPFLFQKGFTGESGNMRKKATGMGLYFVHEIAEDLRIRVEVNAQYVDGFEIILGFPVL